MRAPFIHQPTFGVTAVASVDASLADAWVNTSTTDLEAFRSVAGKWARESVGVSNALAALILSANFTLALRNRFLAVESYPFGDQVRCGACGTHVGANHTPTSTACREAEVARVESQNADRW